VKSIELKLISELMKNSRRSDRELAKAIGVSQPTVSRIIKKLEREGIIKEYTMIPDFAKLGYGLMSFLFVNVKRDRPEDLERSSKGAVEEIQKNVFPDLLNEGGLGMNFDGINVTLHRNYSDYTKQVNYVKTRAFVQADRTDSFLVDLRSPVHFRSLTLSLVANDLVKSNEKESKVS
jgi:DNA-binding Lrp family transcriptional regulator